MLGPHGSCYFPTLLSPSSSPSYLPLTRQSNVMAPASSLRPSPQEGDTAGGDKAATTAGRPSRLCCPWARPCSLARSRCRCYHRARPQSLPPPLLQPFRSRSSGVAASSGGEPTSWGCSTSAGRTTAPGLARDRGEEEGALALYRGDGGRSEAPRLNLCDNAAGVRAMLLEANTRS